MLSVGSHIRSTSKYWGGEEGVLAVYTHPLDISLYVHRDLISIATLFFPVHVFYAGSR